MKLKYGNIVLMAIAIAIWPALTVAQSTTGVTKNEIVIGSIQDLSGPLVSFGKAVRDGMMMRVDQVNAAGGVHGRKIRLAIEDSGYDTKKAVLAADKLLTGDKVFAVIGTLGVAPAVATADTVVANGTLHLFPLNAHKSMFDPFHRLKFAAFTPYSESTRAGLKELLKKGYKRVAILYQDDDFGLDVLNGVEAALKEANLPLVERTNYKRGATDFSSQMQKLKAANPDLIVLATVVRETIGAVSEARKIGYTGEFLGSQGSYISALPKLAGKTLEGVYNMCEVPTPYRDNISNSKMLNDWLDAYKARFGSDAETGGVLGWLVIDMFVRTADKAGSNLTTDTFIKALESTTFSRTFLNTPDMSFSPDKHLGNNKARIAQIQNGRWVNITDFVR